MKLMTPQHLRALAHAYESNAAEDPIGVADAFRNVADELEQLRAGHDGLVPESDGVSQSESDTDTQ